MIKVKEAVKLAKDALDKAAPSILVGAGIIGGTAAGVKAVVDTPKAIAKREDKKKELDITEGRLPILEEVKIDASVYWPSILLGAMSATSIIFAHKIDLRRQAALIAAYELSDGRFKEYKEQVLKTIGEKKEEEIRDKVAKDNVEKNPPSLALIESDDGKVIIRDAMIGRDFKAKIENVKAAINEANKALLDEGALTLNEFYAILYDYCHDDRLGPIEVGDNMGWDIKRSSDGLIDAEFSAQLYNDKPILVMNINATPKYWAFDYS